jgi:glycosyltransferase involved in cell wall biosynthesis
MSMSLPVIASNVGGCREIIDDLNNGILFPAGNTEKFLESVETLMNNKNLAAKLGSNARTTAEKYFSIDRMIKDYSTFFWRL